MKKRYLFLSLVTATISLTTILLANYSEQDLCGLANDENCPKKGAQPKTAPKKQVQGSSPDDIHFRGFNRLIVSTFH